MEVINKALNEAQLESVAGGVSTKGLTRANQWDMACEHYECKLCGMRGTLFANHKDGCAVRNFPYNGSDALVTGCMKPLNSCWSCKHLVKKSIDYSDIYCGHQ